MSQNFKKKQQKKTLSVRAFTRIEIISIMKIACLMLIFWIWSQKLGTFFLVLFSLSTLWERNFSKKTIRFVAQLFGPLEYSKIVIKKHNKL